MNHKKLVIVGCGEFGEIARHYFERYTEYRVVAYAAEERFIAQPTVEGLEIVPFEKLRSTFPPDEFFLFIAITFTSLNRIRARLYREAKALGYRFANFISPNAFIWTNESIGENVFIFEGNVVQRGSTISDNVILWSGNHLGHRCIIDSDVYVSSHVVVSGYTRIGARSFLGVNSCFADRINVGEDCYIAMGTVINNDCEANSIYQGNPGTRSRVPATRFFRIKD